MTPDQVRDEIDRLLGSIGIDTAPWAQQLLKSANSKNIDISEWNTFILKVAEVAASASTLQRIAELLAQDLDINLRDGDYETTPNAIYQNGGSKALSPYAAGLGRDCVAGGKGYKITGIVFGDKVYRGGIYMPTGRVTGYELWTVEGLDVDMIYSVRLITAAYDCGKISKIDGNRIEVENPPQIKGFNKNDDDPENGLVANVLTIKGRPDLGHINVGFNAFSTGDGNYVSERNGFSSGTANYVLGCNGAAFGRENVAGYDALVWGRGNKALVDQSAVGGSFAKQSAHALLTLGNGASDTNRSNAFEVLSTGDMSNSGNATVGKDLTVKGSATFAGEVAVGLPTKVGHAVNGTTLRRYLGSNGNKTASLVFEYAGEYVNVGDNTAIDFSQEEIIKIPSVVGGYPVYGFTEGAFKENLTVKKVIMHKGLSSVGIEAFNGCRGLTYLSFADTIQEICRHAFNNNTHLTQLSLPRDIVYIGQKAFQGAPIKNTITIPQSCKYIGYMSSETNAVGGGSVFNRPTIPAIVFEGKPLKIHAEAFSECTCDIYVPWSEGEVLKPDDSAWGSTGSVHYNYTSAPVKVVQGLGDSAEAVMSQNAVSKELEALDNNLIGIDTQIWSDLEPRIAALENSTPDSISTSVPLYRHCLDIHFNGELDTFSDTVELRMFCSIISSYGAPFEDLTDDPEYAIGAQTHPATGCVISGGVCSPIVYFKGAHHPDGTGLGHVLIGCVRHKEFDGGAIGIQELTVHPYNFAEYTDTVVDTNVEI